ncbi:NAD-binding protein [Methanopyrus sp.]
MVRSRPLVSVPRILLRIPAVRRSLIALMSIILASVIAFHFLEGWSLLTSLYFTAATITTVGYGDVVPTTEAGRLLSVIVMFSGIGVASYALGDIIQLVLRGELSLAIREDVLRKRVEEAENHIIVCGFGRTGSRVAELLSERYKFDVVVVDEDEEAYERAVYRGFPAVLGDATKESTLREANIENARGVVVTTGDDRTNVFVTLLAKNFRSDLHVVAVANSREGAKMMERAGADEVLFLYDCASRHIVRATLSPTMLKVTVRHSVDEISDVMWIIIGNGGVVQRVEYYTPPLKSPIRRDVVVSSMDEVMRFVKSLERDPERKRTLEDLYKVSEDVHTYYVIVHDEEERERIISELDRRGYLVGVDLTIDEILDKIEELRGE